MSSFEEEHLPKEPTAISRYFDRITDEGLKDYEYVFAFDEIVNALAMKDDSVDPNKLFQYVREIKEYTDNERIRAEQFMLLPLRVLSPYVELYKPLLVVSAWYEEMANGILQYTQQAHGPECLPGHALASCGEVSICPVRELRKILTQDAETMNFNSLGYYDNPANAFSIVGNKLALARRKKLINPANYDFINKDYENRYKVIFSTTNIRPDRSKLS